VQNYFILILISITFFLRAFTDCPEYIVADGALGQLQRLITLLYVRRVVILPRFHNEVKACFDANQVL
jgi:hypothetical protein